MVRLVNLRDGAVVVDELTIASSFTRRLTGYMARRRPLPGSGLLLMGVARVHTAFLRFPLDLAFLDGSLRVLEVRRGVRPFSFPASPRGCRHVLEVPAEDPVSPSRLRRGDRLLLSVRVVE